MLQIRDADQAKVKNSPQELWKAPPPVATIVILTRKDDLFGKCR